ncbi:hypothetical protein [Streptomyces roseifaciens]|uniref:hypothetical protein n=1 Tax=Streptomyces roseifaciens TaxID=1488406 RepID=UPI0007C83E10
MVGETVVIRGLAAAAAAAAVVGAVLMRRWDRSAGRRVAQLTAARTRDEWKTEERIAELETDLEDTRAAKARLESKLRGKRAELARLRTEHADLLRRYAAAETGRASALESRRVARGGASLGAPALGPGAPLTVPGPAVDPAAYRKAAEALRSLGGGAAEAEPKSGARPAPGPAALPRQKPASASRAASEAVPQPRPEARPGTERAPESAEPAEAGKPVEAGKPAEPETEGKPEPGAALKPALRAAVPQAPARRPASRATGGFDFFGTQRPAPAQRPVEETDLADVVGEEALAEAKAKAEAEADAEAGKDGERAGDDVIDLTAHDETEQIDVAELRTAAS